MTYSANARRNLLATSAEEPILILLEITQADLDVPIRVVNDTQAIIAQGNEFIACPFQITLPDDVSQQVPQATLSVDNIGRDMTQWLEYSRGGKGAKCRIIQIMRSAPDTFEYDMTLDLTGLSIDNETVSGQLGYQDTMMQPAVAKRFDPFTSPGLY